MATAVLALQGAFAEHEKVLCELGEPSFELREADDLARPFDRLVLPLRERIEGGMPVLATCAGLILLARHIEDRIEDGSARSQVRPAWHFGTLDVTVVRNAYGRQLGSFHTEDTVKGIGKVPMTFIRAPYVSEAGPEAEVLATVGGRIVVVRQESQLALAFHPELDHDLRIHEAFLAL